MKSTRAAAALVAAALVIAACGGGSESTDDSGDRNTALTAASLQQLLPANLTIGPGQKAAVIVGATDDEMCSVDHRGSLWCWGREPSVIVRDQALSVSPEPVRIPMPNNKPVTAVSTGTGDATCAIAGGDVFCWGLNASYIVTPSGAFSAYIAAPTRIANLSGPAIDVAVGYRTACAVIIDGGIDCWGDGRYGTMTPVPPGEVLRGPVVIPYIGNAVKITGGANGFCVIDVKSLLKCWGDNSNGRLGPGLAEPTFGARFPLPNEPVIDVSMSVTHTCAVLATGTVKCFGDNFEEQLGVERGVVFGRGEPQVVSGLPVDAVSVVVGRGQSCAVDESGTMWCWGIPVTFGAADSRPVKVSGMNDLMFVNTTKTHGPTTCATNWSGELLCVGNDSYGALGNGLPIGSRSNTAVTLAGFGVVGLSRTQSTVPNSVSVQTVPTSVDAAATSSQVPSTSTNSASAQPPVTAAQADATSVTVPSVTSPATVRRVLSVKVGKKVTAKSMVRFAGITAPKSSKVKVRVAKTGSRFCRMSGTSVQGKKVGVCSVTIGVTPKGQKTRSRTIFVNVVK